MSLDEFMMDEDGMTDSDGLADPKIDLKAVAEELDIVMARVLDDAALNPTIPAAISFYGWHSRPSPRCGSLNANRR